jgi:hypothetical protein
LHSYKGMKQNYWKKRWSNELALQSDVCCYLQAGNCLGIFRCSRLTADLWNSISLQRYRLDLETYQYLLQLDIVECFGEWQLTTLWCSFFSILMPCLIWSVTQAERSLS